MNDLTIDEIKFLIRLVRNDCARWDTDYKIDPLYIKLQKKKEELENEG